jgi:transforming growth factor-beta-induced protein
MRNGNIHAALEALAVGTTITLSVLAAACSSDSDQARTTDGAAGDSNSESSASGGDGGSSESSGGSSSHAGSGTESSGQTIVDIAAADERFGTLVQAVTDADLAETLSRDGPFTVFAPTDDAFDALPAGLLASLDSEALSEILRYHVVSGAVESSTAATLDRADTLLDGHAIAIQKQADSLYLNGLTMVVSADIQAENGIIHVVDSVLVPRAFPGTVADLVAAYPRLGVLAGAATDEVASLLACDNDTCPEGITLLAPVNGAFDGVELPDSEDELSAVLAYHALKLKAPSETVVSLASVETANGAYLAVKSDSGVQLNDASKDVNVIYTDIEASNGVVHLLDGVLIPPGNIVDVASAAGGFSALLAAASAADVPGSSSTFAEALAGEGPFTLFAPVDEAFAALPEEGFGEDLATVLGAHAFPAALDSAAVVAAIEAAGESPATLTDADDNTLQLSLMDGAVMINGGVEVTKTDIPASNGLIHVVDAVILPKDVVFPGTIVDALSAYPAFSSLVTAASNADAAVISALSGDGPLTLFAPLNPAFAGVDTSQDLTNVLLYHTLSGAYEESDVASAFASPGAIGTAEGSEVTIDATNGTVNDANIVRTDLRTNNGVIHLIDAILVPE